MTQLLSMNTRVLPASCRQRDRRKALPARCRQHLGGAFSLVRGSWSQCIRKTKGGLSMNRCRPRQVLECASPLALWQWRRANQKRQRTGAVQDATARSEGSWSQCMRKNERRLSMNLAPFADQDGQMRLPDGNALRYHNRVNWRPHWTWLIFLVCLGGSATARAQIDPEKRRLFQFGYNQPLQGRWPLSGYELYYYKEPNFIETNLP